MHFVLLMMRQVFKMMPGMPPGLPPGLARRTNGLPPGLARMDMLPPGLARHVNGGLPPGRPNNGNGNGIPPKHLMTMLATLMLNKRLQQGGPRQPVPPQDDMRGMAGHRMADLARMQLMMGRQRPRMY